MHLHTLHCDNSYSALDGLGNVHLRVESRDRPHTTVINGIGQCNTLCHIIERDEHVMTSENEKAWSERA
jgi:hypothetical protein